MAGEPNWFLALPVPFEPGWWSCGEGLPAGVRRFDPADWHLTVSFLGPCGSERAWAAWTALARCSHPPISVGAAGWRALGPAARPSACALTLATGAAAAAELLRRWGAAARHAAGLPEERRPPLPHITLARPLRRHAAALRRPLADWMAAAPVPTAPLTLDRIALFTWATDRRLGLFQILAARPLEHPESLQLLPPFP